MRDGGDNAQNTEGIKWFVGVVTMNNPNSIEQVIESAELRKSNGARGKTGSHQAIYWSPRRGLGTSDSVRKLMDSTARPDRISDLLESTERFGISDSVRKLMDCAARSGDISDLLKSTSGLP